MRIASPLLISLCCTGPLLAADAQPVLAVSIDTPTVAYGTWANVDSLLNVSDSDGGLIDGVRVTIDNLQSGDALRVDPAIGLAALGLTASFSGPTGVLSINGNAAASTYQNVLRAVQINAVAGVSSRSIVFVLGTAVGYKGAGHSTTHFYQYIGSAGSITWSAARTAAAGRSYFGLQGYLATITSAGENAYITEKLSSDAWIGASDATTEGDWSWVTGPELGTQFSTGNTTPAAVSGRYMNWNSSEPNDSAPGEDCAEIFCSSGTVGRWNDLADGSTSVLGYVVEYGDMGGDPVVSISGTRTIALGGNVTPVFTPGPDLLVAEDAGAQSVAWATDISVGPANEAAQVPTFAVTNSNHALFSAQPAIAADGTLTFTPAADASGTTIVGVRLSDSGDGANTTAIAYFTITVSSENDAPGQAVPTARTVLEDQILTISGVNAVVLSDVDAGSSWVTTTLRVNHGTLSLAQTDDLVFLVGTGTHESVVTIEGSIAAINAALDGLSVDPGQDYNGPIALSIITNDNGNTGNGGSQGVSGSLGITVTPVNDAPSCILGAAQTVRADGKARSLAGWITAVSAGPANEASQVLSFEVSVDRPELFRVQPAIAANGTLSFTPGKKAGHAVLTVRAVDNGGTANGGIDHGVALSTSITLTSTDAGDGETIWVKNRNNVTSCGGGSAMGLILASLGLMFTLRRRR